MRIYIRGKDQVKITDSVYDYVESKVLELEKLFSRSDAINVNVLCKRNEKYSTVEITIPMKHVILRAESKGDTLFAAVDFAVDKIERQLLRHKKKVNSMIRKREGIAEYFTEQLNSGIEDISDQPQSIKTKEVDMQVMSIEEAITQMELLDHDFYMFVNEDNHKVTLVYLREDGGYGTIEQK